MNGCMGCTGLDPNLKLIGYYLCNGDTTTHPVGELEANLWDLFDTSGNVKDWIWDVYGDYAGDEIDPEGAATGESKVYRGGNWASHAKECRNAHRKFNVPEGRLHMGFRMVRTLPTAP